MSSTLAGVEMTVENGQCVLLINAVIKVLARTALKGLLH
jgi:hypothetical protein